MEAKKVGQSGDKKERKPMLLELKRFKDDGNTTLGRLFIDGEFSCWIVEDEHREEKVWGEMRIPEGTFDVSFRYAGRFHNSYKKKFPEMHEAILCVHNAPDWKLIVGGKIFQYILIHIGNTERDTAGCLLPNTLVNEKNMTGSGSTIAYKKIYPIIADHLKEGGLVQIKVTSDAENL